MKLAAGRRMGKLAGRQGGNSTASSSQWRSLFYCPVAKVSWKTAFKTTFIKRLIIWPVYNREWSLLWRLRIVINPRWYCFLCCIYGKVFVVIWRSLVEWLSWKEYCLGLALWMANDEMAAYCQWQVLSRFEGLHLIRPPPLLMIS